MDYPRQRQRHTRAMVRHHKQRHQARRRRKFARWTQGHDWQATTHRMAPRPQEVREAEFWDGRRNGLLAKWNGGNSKRRGRAINAYRLPSKAELQERARLEDAA